jgi:DnaJ-class molecular chaperone
MMAGKKTPKAPYGNKTKYADPGYQKDGKKRYPIDTADHVRAAWSYINKAKNAAKYTSSQVSAIKGRIKSAAKKLGVKIGGEADSADDLIAALEEAKRGSNSPSKRECPRCKGDGQEPGSNPPRSCKRCGGSGWDPK